jgi:hypothetical protein
MESGTCRRPNWFQVMTYFVRVIIGTLINQSEYETYFTTDVMCPYG